MQLFVPVLVLLSTLVAAAPATAADGRGATVFTSKNLKGSSTAIPANGWCNDLNNLFGLFDGRVRSITVEKGYHCEFYTTHDCTANGRELECGSKDKSSVFSELGALDLQIHSAYCALL